MGFVAWFGILAELFGMDTPRITDFFRLYCPGFNALSYCAVTDVEMFCCFCNIEIFFIHTEYNGIERKGVAMDKVKRQPLTFKCRHVYSTSPDAARPGYRNKPTNADKVGVWQFDCPYCKRPHTHGPLPGHRVAHCDTKNEENKRGYYLVLGE